MKIDNVSLKDFKNIAARRTYLEKKSGTRLLHTAKYSLDDKIASSRHCENMIGVTQIPLGVAGPLRVNGQYAKGNFYLPLATTEGALVASVNRGCKAINAGSGVLTQIENIGATRGSVFQTASGKKSADLVQWFKVNLLNLQQLLKKSRDSQHISLLKIDTGVVGKNVYARFYFDTTDAMGLNMATIATNNLVPYIVRETKATCIALAGNFDIDKKPAWLNFINGRGKRVWAETIISKKNVEEVLKTSPQKIVQVAKDKCLLGSIMSGSLGFNGHFANIIAALFIACGQDPAHVVDGSLGITDAQIDARGDLYISVYLPDLMVGTIGGGTSLATQKEALELLGVYGGNNGKNALKFAEIVAGAVLAGEISLLASLAQGSLAGAHLKLAWGRRDL